MDETVLFKDLIYKFVLQAIPNLFFIIHIRYFRACNMVSRSDRDGSDYDEDLKIT